MARFAILVYELVAYAVFFGTFLYAIWFGSTLDRPANGAAAPLSQRLLINAVLLAAFALQHSIMARQGFKRAWTKIVPKPAERSTFVLMASLVLLALIRFWQPVLNPIWTVENAAAAVLHALFWVGWATVFVSTFLIDHFDLFGKLTEAKTAGT